MVHRAVREDPEFPGRRATAGPQDTLATTMAVCGPHGHEHTDTEDCRVSDNPRESDDLGNVRRILPGPLGPDHDTGCPGFI